MPVKVRKNDTKSFVAETKTGFENKNLIDFFALLYKVDRRVNPNLYSSLQGKNSLKQSFVTGASASFSENKPAV